MKIFYARCSTVEQNEARQIAFAKEIGAEKIFLDKTSGATTQRPALKEMLDFVREGDAVYVMEIARLGRSAKDLLNIIDALAAKNVRVVSSKENLDTNTPQGKFMLTVFSAMSELERDTIRQRQLEGIALAKEQKKYRGRVPIAIDEATFRKECMKWRAGEQTAVQTFKKLGLKKNTFYKAVKTFKV